MFMQIWLILCKKTLNVVTLDCATALLAHIISVY